MVYQGLARKWRPKRFDEVIGQRGVTQTLRNMIATDRIAQAFVFAGARGVGKTTTARILARALNCEKGPTADPCGVCDACVEIAEGRDMDVLEIDAATHTQVENVRDVIISGLAISPVRDRYKVFIIDEVHQLSAHSFNALLKSIEEPPPHVMFMMATTELGKIPDTILSRSQVFEFRTIGTSEIARQLRHIADAEGVKVDETALHTIARFAEGSMRDAESAFDQVIAFSAGGITNDDVSATLGLVGRDLLIDVFDAVATEDGATLFQLVDRAVEAGYDLRHVCRELSKLARDLLLISIDRSRVNDPDVVPEQERDRVIALAERFSREDLMRAFDVLARAEADIRNSAQPRYHLEMSLLRWVYLRNLTPLADVIDELRRGDASPRARAAPAAARPSMAAPPSNAPRPASQSPERTASPPAARQVDRQTAASAGSSGPPPRPSGGPAPDLLKGSATAAKIQPPAAPQPVGKFTQPAEAIAIESGALQEPAGLKDALLAEIRKAKKYFYGTVVAQAQRIDVAEDRVTFTFGPVQNALRVQLEQNRPWLESIASQLAGRRVTVGSAQSPAAAETGQQDTPAPSAEDRKARLRAEALADEDVQAMLDVFKAEIRDVEEM